MLKIEMTEKKHTLTIGGKPVQGGSIDMLVAQLQALPSAYKERRRVFTPLLPLEDNHSPAGKEIYAAHNTSLAQVGCNHYKRAAELYAADGKFLEEADALSRAAQQLLFFIPPFIYRPIPPEEAITLLNQSISYYEKNQHLNFAYFDYDYLYQAQSKAFTHYKSIGDTEHMDKAAQAMAELRVRARALRNDMYGGADPTAHRVEEGEIGFSADERIGTDLVSQCVTILARDPKTHKTAIAHIDYQVNLDSLDQLFAGFGDGKIEMRLIGASHTESDHSKNNLEKVLRHLADKNVDIISADILQGPSAAANAVVDPKDFSVEEKIPTRHTINANIGNALLSFCKNGKPLEVQFDLTKNKERAPIFLTREALGDIRKHYEHKDEAEIERYLHHMRYYDLPIGVDDKLELVHAYQQEWHVLEATLDRTIKAQGADAEQAGRAHAALAKQRFYIGENAAKANAPIHAWLEHELLVNGTCQFNASLRLDTNINRLPNYADQFKRSNAQNQHGAAK